MSVSYFNSFYLLASSINSNSPPNSALVRWYWSGSVRALSRISNTTELIIYREKKRKRVRLKVISEKPLGRIFPPQSMPTITEAVF